MLLRSYPLITMVCLQQTKAAARVSSATKLASVFSKLTRSLRKRFSQECVRSTTHRLALYPGFWRFASASSFRCDMRPIAACQHCLGCRVALVSGVGAQTLWLSSAGLWPLADHFVQGDSQQFHIMYVGSAGDK